MIMATKKKFIPLQFVIGLIQLIAFWTIIAYVWSVFWGVLIYLRAKKRANAKDNNKSNSSNNNVSV